MELLALEKHAVKDNADVTRVLKNQVGALEEGTDFEFRDADHAAMIQDRLLKTRGYVAENTLRMRSIEVARVTDTEALASTGLQAGERLILSRIDSRSPTDQRDRPAPRISP